MNEMYIDDDAWTHRMYMITPMAQQSTGLPYLCLPTTSGAIRESLNYDNESNKNIKYNSAKHYIIL